MGLIGLRDVSVGHGGPLLLDHANLQIQAGERVCLVGRNGAGKSTLIRLLSGELLPDEGEVVRQLGLRIGQLPQEVPDELAGPVGQVVGAALESGDGANRGLTDDADWRKQRRVELTLARMGLDPQPLFETLSAGLKRRVLLARGLVTEPDLLLLDEPTNHLDIESIAWMEDFLARFSGTLVFVTHDRMFLKRLATRIVELDRGRLVDWACDYATYLKRREAALAVEAEQSLQFDKKLAREEAWIRQGIKARRTRNEGRVRALQQMRETRKARRQQAGTVRLKAQEAARTGKLIMEAEGLTYGYPGEKPIIRDFSTLVLRGDKVGIIGPNGSGKTTLLRLLLGEVTPQAGQLRHGLHLQVSYFDQLRALLDEDKSVMENVGEGNDTILFNGRPRHVMGYLQDFLFSPDRARSPVRVLSGGERNRLLLARLFTKPSNVLVMDEPTNDLDTETLELLEELLLEYEGTLLLVSHDRAFLNNVVTSTLVLEGDGIVGDYVGGYDDWLRQRRPQTENPTDKPSQPAKPQRAQRDRRPGLSFKEKRELEALPEHIEQLEVEQKRLYQLLSDPSFYQQTGEEVAGAKAALEAVERDLEADYQRWEHLESLKEEG